MVWIVETSGAVVDPLGCPDPRVGALLIFLVIGSSVAAEAEVYKSVPDGDISLDFGVRTRSNVAWFKSVG
jgi:hypothetical protein